MFTVPVFLIDKVNDNDVLGFKEAGSNRRYVNIEFPIVS